MDEIHARIRDGLHALREARRPVHVFGSQLHGFHLNPPLSEPAVRDFEREHRINLPADYRAFLLHVGNGGAGPAYGLFKLGETDDCRGHAPWQENDGTVGVLSKPFPYTGPWNDVAGRPEEEDEPSPAEIRAYDAAYAHWQEQYFSSDHVSGAIPICDLGCALRHLLVVTGSEAGNVWCDSRADHEGIYPLEQTGLRRVTFLQWYMAWLDEALRQLRNG